MAWPYIFFIGMLAEIPSFFGIYCILTIVLCVGNIVNACNYKGEQTARELGLFGMVTKLVHMPFYIVVLLLGIMMAATMTMETNAMQTPFVIFFLIIIGFLFMITSSTYCAKAAMAAKDLGIIKKDMAMMMSICSFIFVGDVVCAVLIYSKIKKNKMVKMY